MAARVRFGLLVAMFQAMSKDRTSAKKRGRLRVFLDRAYGPSGRDDYFSALRLVLPGLDRERGSYGLKEAVLATVLVDALGIAKDSTDAVRLINWRRGGGFRNAGNFSLVAAEVLQRRQGMASGGLTIKEVNDALDRLAATENRSEKASIISSLIKKTNALEMKWLLMIILKDLKLGISEKSIFQEFHPDAEDLFNVTCDLKFVCEKLNDRSQRHKRQDIEVGKVVRPQLAMRASNASAAWKKLHGKQVVAECKFDGDHIQIHKSGEEIHFFSRSFLDHSEYAPGMSKVIKENILVDRCILDGEMLVWDTVLNRFAEFGSNQEIAKAAREGLETDRQLCYVAFDILYAGDTSVIHQSLTERHEILHKVVKPSKGHLEVLVPAGGLNLRRPSDEPCWSTVAHNLEDVEKFFKETIDNREEGIVLKDLESKWEPGDRSGKWLKLKPDYIHAGADLDVLIIGGYYGSGRRGGEVARFLVGLAVPSDDNSYPKRFLSFCRVGTGLSDEELNVLVSTLKPFFRKNEYPKKAPRFYEVTNNSKERPDVWIESPDKSVIISITSDIRTIKSEVFAAPYCLRFPRNQRVRYDKPWHECLNVQAFVDIVHSSNGTMHKAVDDDSMKNDNTKHSRTNKKGEKKKKSTSIIPSHVMKTYISGLKGETLVFANMIFYFVNIPSSYELEHFHKLVVENGGSFSMNLNDSVTHCIAAEKKGIKYQAATRQGRIIHYSWILDCCKEKCLLHLRPKYILFLADFARHKFPEEIDPYADYYYWDIDIADLKQPQSKNGINSFGGLGATLVDSLDTLYIMDLKDEFQKARDWVAESLDFDKDYDASVFETTIRVVGGLLSAYDLSGDKIFLDKAKDITDRLLPAWDTTSGIPYNRINLAHGRAHNPGWTNGDSILADSGTEQLEFIALSQRTGDPKYQQKAENVIIQLQKIYPGDGLLPIYINPHSGTTSYSTITFGAMGDSFYEYLLKVWVQGNKTEHVKHYRQMWETSMEGLISLIRKTTPSNYHYICEKNGGSLSDKMDELACFAPGMLALGASGYGPEKSEQIMNLAKELASTCYNFYQTTPTKLAGENYFFHDGRDMSVGTSWNILRPETVESLMYLWRLTGNKTYQDWGWDIFQAFEKNSRVESGYVGLRDVNTGEKDNMMQSFFLAETLKYLYLLFSPPSVISFDEWVFNTEAHPLRIVPTHDNKARPSGFDTPVVQPFGRKQGKPVQA